MITGAVKFNHPLTVDECRHLMHSLAQCSLPFQCAHGRPSILPLADLQHMVPEPEVSTHTHTARDLLCPTARGEVGAINLLKTQP